MGVFAQMYKKKKKIKICMKNIFTTTTTITASKLAHFISHLFFFNSNLSFFFLVFVLCVKCLFVFLFFDFLNILKYIDVVTPSNFMKEKKQRIVFILTFYTQPK